MQPYSELANWNGSLSAPDSRSPTEPPDMLDPLPTDPLSLHDNPPSMYDLYHHQASRPVAPTPSSSNALFLPDSQDSVLSPQEREIMADITLDPDDPTTWSRGEAENDKDASASALNNNSVDASANVFQSRSPSVTAASQPHLIPVVVPTQAPPPPRLPQPAPPAVASTSSSVSPSPFAPRASVASPFSKSSSSPPSHPAAATTNEVPDMDMDDRAHTDRLAVTPAESRGELDEDDGMLGDSSQTTAAGPCAGGVGQEKTPTVDPPPLDLLGPPSQQSQVPPVNATRRSSSSRSSRVSQKRSSKTPLFLPSPSESVPHSRPQSDPPPPDKDAHPELLDIISITDSSSSSSSPPPQPPPPRAPRRSTRNKPQAKQGRQLMAYILVPSLPSGMHESDYVPLEEMLRLREHRGAAKDNVRVGDNSGSAELAAALQGAFENNSSGAGRTNKPGKRRRARRGGKQKAVEPVEVVDDEDEDEDGDQGETQNQGSTTLVHALSAAFAHNSANPNVAASAVARASGSTRQLRRSTRAEMVSDSTDVEVVAQSPSKRPRAPTRPRATTNNQSLSTPTSRRRKEKRHPMTPSSPQNKRRRLTQRQDDAGVHDAEDDNEIEIVESVPQELRRSPRSKPGSKAVPPQRKPSRTSQQRRASMPSRIPISIPTSGASPSPSPTPPPQSPPATPPPDNSALPLTILPAPSSANIVIPPRALSHLHPSADPPDPGSGTRAGSEGVGGSAAQTHHASLQGFHCEEAAVGAHGLLESPAAAATTMDSSARATTITTTTDQHHPPLPLDLGLDIDVPMDIGGGEPEQVQERQDAVRAAVVPQHALRISSSTHPDGPMLGFALSEHEGPGRASLSADADTDASSDGFGLGLGANTSPDMDFTMASLNPCFGNGAGWVDWGVAGPSTTIVPGDEYVGDGTIDPSVLGGGGGRYSTSPGAGGPRELFRSDTVASDGYARSLTLRGPAVVRAIGVDKVPNDVGDEGDVEGLLFDNLMDGEFVPSGSKSKAAAGAKRIGADDVRIRTKTWRKAQAEESRDTDDTDTEIDDGEESDEPEHLDVRPARRGSLSSPSPSSASLQALLTLTFCHHCRRKTTRPKMRCTTIRQSTGVQCRKLYCNLCIEKRYPDLTFDEFATSFTCPSCRDFCNCTQCARARGEEYIPERNGGWRKFGSWPAPAAAVTANGPSQSQQRTPQRDAVGFVERARKSSRRGSGLGAPSISSEDTEEAPVSTSGTRNTSTAVSMPQDDATMRTVPTQLSASAPPPAPASASASTTAIADALPSPPVSQHHKKRRRYTYIGKRLKAWGRLVSVPDPEEQPQRQQRQAQRKKKGPRKRKRAGRVRVRLFAGSEEPLLLAKKRQRAKKRRHRRRRDLSPAAASLSVPTSSPVRAAAAAAYGEVNGDADEEADGGSDEGLDEGVWPGEYAVPLPLGVVAAAAAAAVGKRTTTTTSPNSRAVLRITPEVVQRAIGAALAVGGQ